MPYSVVVHQQVRAQLERAPEELVVFVLGTLEGLQADPYESTAFYRVTRAADDWMDATFAGGAGFLTYQVNQARKVVFVRWVTWLG